MRQLGLLLLLASAAIAGDISLYWSPRGGAADALVHELAGATRTVDVAIYSLNHPGITSALIAAHRRGVRVRVIADKTQAAGASSTTGALPGEPHVRRGSGGGIMHLKLAVIDQRVACFGSFNYTVPADERNDEVLAIVRDPAVARACAGRFEALWRRP